MSMLTDRAIQKAKANEKSSVYMSDGHGLYIRVMKSGNKAWVYRMKDSGGKTRWIDLGVYPDMSLSDARSEAAILNSKRRQGIDPVEEKKNEESLKIQEQKLKEAKLTVIMLFDRWEKFELSRRKDNGAEARRSFEKDVFPTLGELLVENVTRSMIVMVLDKVVERGARIVARNLLGDIRQMFGFAILRDVVESDPTSRLRRDDFGRKTERERVLTDTEVRILPDKLIKARMAQSSIATIWIMLSTCCRIGEISQARWIDVDLDNGVWCIPAENAKNAKKHTIHLSQFAIEHFRKLKELKEVAIIGEWVLPARWESKEDIGHVSPKSLAKQIGDRQRGNKEPMSCRSNQTDALIMPGGNWTPHDLRRTGATMMGTLGVRPDVIEKCLNHTPQNKLIRIYQRQELKSEQKDAWILLGDKLDELVNTNNNR